MRKYKRTELEFLKESEGLTSEGLTDEVVAKFKDDKENVPVVLGGIGQTFPSSKYYISRKRSPTFTLEYVVKGKGYVIENNIERTVGPDDVFLLHYGATQNYYPDKNDPFHKIWVNFNSDIFASAIKVMNLENEVVYHAPECKDDFLYLLKLSDLTTSNSAISYEVSNVIFKILTTLAQKINERDMLDDLPTTIRNELNKSIYKHTTVEEIADKMMRC